MRVSNELGAGNATAVKFSIIFILSTSTVIGVFFWILCLVFGHDIAYLFTSNDEVAETVSSLSILLAFSILFNSIQPVFIGKSFPSLLLTILAIVSILLSHDTLTEEPHLHSKITRKHSLFLQKFFFIFIFLLAGVAVGAGWQKLVAFVNLGCYYLIGVPFGALLAYVADLSVRVSNSCLNIII